VHGQQGYSGWESPDQKTRGRHRQRRHSGSSK
jgi:hypothetical protein